VFIGELAAVFAALCFSLTSTMFTLSGKKFGPILVMRSSLPIAIVIIVAFYLVTNRPLPFDAELYRWLFLGASGVIGFWLASVCILNAFVLIGPRLAGLIVASGPIFGSIIAWIFLDQHLTLLSMVGIALTIGGIVFVVLEKDQDLGTIHITPETYRKGVLFSFAAALLQAVSFNLASEGLAGDFDPLNGSLIRLLAGTAALWLLAAFQGKIRSSIDALVSNPLAFKQMSVGAVAGPVIGASLVMFSLQVAPVGIATALANLAPIFIIPISYVVFKERITMRAIIGTFIAVCGTAVLLLF